MPGTVAEGPTVSMSFANNFWGKDDAGLQPMLDRMHCSKTTSDELKAFYSVRAAIEDEYARKLSALCRKSLGASETGSLRLSLDVVRGETEAIAKAHSAIAGQMKTELEEPLSAFASGLKERRKIIQNTIERLHKTKVQQTQVVNKTRDRYEQDCLRIKGYLAQGHMVMGQEERKNKAKLEKTQIQLASNSNEYEAAVKTLEETTGRWNKEWKAACDKFQDLEEERLDFSKSSLWTYANIASTVCVSDDASCEKIRLSLEGCEVEKDIVYFIKDKGTGQEIPDPPRFINFCKEDTDTGSEVDEGEGYSVAQFQRTMNPAFRTSSPQPSTFESHHDPQSDLAAQMGHPAPHPAQENAQQPPPLDLRRVDNSRQTMIRISMERSMPFLTTLTPLMSEVSNPTSMSSIEQPMTAKPPPKPTNSEPLPSQREDKQATPKKKTAFFSNSPFRRKSRHDKERPAIGSQSSRSPWSSPTKQASPPKAPQPQPQSQPQPQLERRTRSPEPVDPRANFQLNIGNNVFDVASPEKNAANRAAQKAKGGEDDADPIARALADLKTTGKQSTLRVSADRYHGISTPTPSAPSSTYGGSSSGAPPAYHDPSVKRLDAPEPAFTSKQMQKTTQRYTAKSQEVPRARSPAPSMRRSASPQVSPRIDTRSGYGSGGASPAPSPTTYQSSSARSRYSQSPTPRRAQEPPYSPNDYARRASPAASSHRAVSPQPAFRQQTRPSSAGGMELQLSNQADMYGGGSSYSSRHDGRPMSQYGGDNNAPPPVGRSRSRTVAVADPGRKFSRDGRPILHFARSMYTYSAAIPEELGFTKGDVLAVIRLQDDGWWEAEVTNARGHPGLVPSNYLQII
ncbi:hypothetical protein N7509_008921 [Penicillium cosmopolitanum]|uniref:SH3 domain-containing protein n=1 Tax=Penicillium cosmopolitanum TaxID=1131564 RepID=A0A9W9VNL6_9EURO|nr:uncharacterized protein N7509_008921 [Penicillium cosmopolitanum]KAJ5386380.1 hypothetical protein N7509_008921 [Penicillium cosmopolitanum]